MVTDCRAQAKKTTQLTTGQRTFNAQNTFTPIRACAASHDRTTRRNPTPKPRPARARNDEYVPSRLARLEIIQSSTPTQRPTPTIRARYTAHTHTHIHTHRAAYDLTTRPRARSTPTNEINTQAIKSLTRARQRIESIIHRARRHPIDPRRPRVTRITRTHARTHASHASHAPRTRRVVFCRPRARAPIHPSSSASSSPRSARPHRPCTLTRDARTTPPRHPHIALTTPTLHFYPSHIKIFIITHAFQIPSHRTRAHCTTSTSPPRDAWLCARRGAPPHLALAYCLPIRNHPC
jgi:hypothetical protein